MKKLLLGTILGGLTVFLWSAVSWMVLPWHNTQFQTFADEAAVSAVLKANAPTRGLYLLPSAHGASKDDKSGEAGVERMRAGPFLFGVVRTDRHDWNFGQLLRRSFLIQAAAAFMITALLLTTRLPSYFGRVLFVTVVAGVAGILGHLPNYNWWEFPAGWTFVSIADLVIGWFFAGLVLAAIARVDRLRP
jgi:hypothetical protein